MTTTTTKTRKPVEKRGLTEIGKFFAKVRIDLGITSEQWAKKLGVSASYVNNVERGNKEFDLKFVRNVLTLLELKHQLEFADIVATVLGVLVIPAGVSPEQLRNSFLALYTKPEVEAEAEVE